MTAAVGHSHFVKLRMKKQAADRVVVIWCEHFGVLISPAALKFQ
jgi:hypothetical protein